MMRLSLYLLATIISTISLTSHAQSVQSRYLVGQNIARLQVGVKPLIWNDTIALYAQKIAKEVEATCNHVKQPDSPYGENTAVGYISTIESAVDLWVSEKSNYDHKLNKCINESTYTSYTPCNHYTQVVWRRSLQVGCAGIVCGAGWPYYVCEYYPPGNIKGESPY